MNEKELTISIQFEEPLEVSQSVVQDKLIIKFKDPDAFISK